MGPMFDTKCPRTREQELLFKLQRDANSKDRRATGSKTGMRGTRPSSASDKGIPSIPHWLLKSIKPDNVRRDLILWRGVWNSDARHLTADERTEKLGSSDKGQINPVPSDYKTTAPSDPHRTATLLERARSRRLKSIGAQKFEFGVQGTSTLRSMAPWLHVQQ